MRVGPNLWLKIEVDSGNAAVVTDPEDAIDHILDQIRNRKPYLMDGSRTKLHDRNGNAVGRYWIEFTPEEDDDCNC